MDSSSEGKQLQGEAWGHKEKKETALSDKRDVQMLRQMFHLTEDDQIYRLYRICIAPFSNNRSTLSLPVGNDAIMTI